MRKRVARNHGLKKIGLPSRFARFATTQADADSQIWWKPTSDAPAVVSVRNMERRGWLSRKRGLKSPVCTFIVEDALDRIAKGPKIHLTLPSFRSKCVSHSFLILLCSGCTTDVPDLVKYACQLSTFVRPVKPLKLHFEEESDPENDELMTAVLKGRPLCSLLFEDMTVRSFWIKTEQNV